MTLLATCHRRGWGAPRDPEKAFELYQAAAALGSALAMGQLGVCYERGEGVPQDERAAAEWAREAAGRGDATGTCNLGVYLQHGIGAPETARHRRPFSTLLRPPRAAAPSDANCVRPCPCPCAGVRADPEQAFACFKKAVELKHPRGTLNLCAAPPAFAAAPVLLPGGAADELAPSPDGRAHCCALGAGCPRDGPRAARLYHAAATGGGQAEAAHALGRAYLEGLLGLQKSTVDAARWLRRAAAGGFPLADHEAAVVESLGQALGAEQLPPPAPAAGGGGGEGAGGAPGAVVPGGGGGLRLEGVGRRQHPQPLATAAA